MHYWLFKSEPTTFSIDDLRKRPKQTEHWDGVRNYQVRNMLRHEIKIGDQGFFYHSSCKPPGIAGIIEVVRDAYPDYSAWDLASPYYDPKSTAENPRWYMVDVKLVRKFSRFITLDEIKRQPKLHEMRILRKGNRLSITPVKLAEWKEVLKLAEIK